MRNEFDPEDTSQKVDAYLRSIRTNNASEPESAAEPPPLNATAAAEVIGILDTIFASRSSEPTSRDLSQTATTQIHEIFRRNPPLPQAPATASTPLDDQEPRVELSSLSEGERLARIAYLRLYKIMRPGEKDENPKIEQIAWSRHQSPYLYLPMPGAEVLSPTSKTDVFLSLLFKPDTREFIATLFESTFTSDGESSAPPTLDKTVTSITLGPNGQCKGKLMRNNEPSSPFSNDSPVDDPTRLKALRRIRDVAARIQKAA